MQSSLLRLASLLEKLAIDANKLDAANANKKSHYYHQDTAIFDEKLFPIHSAKYIAYVKFLQQRNTQLQKLVENTDKQMIDVLFEQLQEQVMAVVNALKANENLHNDSEYRLNRRHRLNAKNKTSNKSASADTNNYGKKLAKAIMASSQQLHQKLAEYKGFESRLQEMLLSKESELHRDKKNSTRLQQELLALHQRLGRCRKAISEVEKQILDAKTRN